MIYINMVDGWEEEGGWLGWVRGMTEKAGGWLLSEAER